MIVKTKSVMRSLFLALFLMVLSASPTMAADSHMVTNISKEFVCQCGCGMVLGSCNHAECSSVATMTATIEEQLDQGISKGQILQSFVKQYGEQVLSAPTKRGFNLTAWVLPFAALTGGGIVVYGTLRTWVRRGSDYHEIEKAEVEEVDERYRDRLEKEFKEFTER